MSRKYEIDMTSGSLWGKMLVFAIPLILSSMLQLLFNAADLVVIGNFAGKESLSAVGCTGSLVNLIVNLLLGLSVGASVLVAQYYGARQDKDVNETVHTAITVALVGGVIVGIVGFFLSKPMLALMDTPDDVIDKATLYMRIYFVGLPFMSLYNFGASLLRAVGDTKRPMIYLAIAGVVNVILNMLTVIVLHMDVAGVAIATTVSQAVSAVLVTLNLCNYDGCMRLDLKRLRIFKDKVIGMAKVGIPSGLQGMTFSISNVLIQSSVNSFETIVMAGNTAAANIEGFIWVAMNAFHQAALSFMGQNIGAKKYNRISYVARVSVIYVSVIGLVLGAAAFLAREPLIGIYESDPEVIKYGAIRMSIIATTYFTCGIMDVLVGLLRGMGSSLGPMLVSVLGVCGLRIAWIYTIFKANRTLETLFLSYPVSWVITALILLVCFFVVKRKFKMLPDEKILV